MKILYHITNLHPKILGTEAILQEIDILRETFGGDLFHLNPNIHSPIYLPRLLFGFHLLKKIRKIETDLDLHHLYNADPFPFPVAIWLKRPVIYSISSGVGRSRPLISFLNSLAAVTVSDERSYKRLQTWGVKNCHLVRPGIDTSKFSFQPLPLTAPFKLLFASAPWTLAQFKTKGVEALLAAVAQMPHVHLTCLWRGVLADEMQRRVKEFNLEQRVRIINEKVDVNALLGQVHATINLVENPAVIRSYPHSLIESLVAGKPVIVSRTIPMADYVAQTGCGVVVDAVTPAAVVRAINTLKENYNASQQAAQSIGPHDFSRATMVDSFRQVYRHVIEATE